MKNIKLIALFLVGAVLIITSAYGVEKASQTVQDFYKEIETFADAISIVRMTYVVPTEPKTLITGALKGMLASLDDYSQFLEPDGYKEIKDDTRGEFGGVGVEIGIRDGMLTVISPMDGTPADKAGLKANDIVVKLDDQITKNMVLHDAVKIMRGKPGTKVKITVWREKEGKYLDFEIERAIIEVKSIRTIEMIDGEFGYIRLSEFQEGTAKELEDALKEFTAKKACGIILDLRNNAGGLLNSAVDVSDLLLKKGTLIVSIKGRITEQNKDYFVTRESGFTDMPLVVLVNEGSASASEIVAGAVKDTKRGIILGQKTFGKGCVQTVIPLKDNSAIKLTTAEYFTPSGVSIHKKGIIPDVIVSLDDKKVKSEKDDDKEDDIFNKLQPKESATQQKKDLKQDKQIKSACDTLKIVNLNINR